MTKSFELEPTRENLLNSLSEDLIGRNKNVWQFARFLDLLDDKCSIALDAQWGYGKTFFVKQTQLLIEAFNPNIKSLKPEEISKIKGAFSSYIGSGSNEANFTYQLCCYYDAWANDNDSDPLLSLVYSITQSVGSSFSFSTTPSFFATAAKVFDAFSGKNIEKLYELIKENKPLIEIEGQKEIHELVKDFLNQLMEERGNRLLVFIDELDRCKPSYAVKLLERIKHYFENEYITFVFSVNIDELQHTIRHFYGDAFDATRYLDRFFDFQFSLPPADMGRYDGKIGLNSEMQNNFSKIRYAVSQVFFSGLRDREKYCRTINIIHKNQMFTHPYIDGKDSNGLCLSLYVLVPILVGLKMSNASLYCEFINGQNVQPLLDVMKRVECSDWILEKLLFPDETFDDKNVTDSIHKVTTEAKLNQFYNAVFNGSDLDFKNIVGNCSFKHTVKRDILDVASMLSGFARY